MRILAIYFTLNGHRAEVVCYSGSDEGFEDEIGPWTLLFRPPARWDQYGDVHRWDVDDTPEHDFDVVAVVQRFVPLDILIMNRPGRDCPEVEPWDGTRARAEHWTWAAGIWAGVARALGCTKIRTMEVTSVEELLAAGRKLVGGGT